MTIKEFYNECVALKVENYELWGSAEGNTYPIESIIDVEISNEYKMIIIGD